MTAKGGPFIIDVEVDGPFGHSAEPARNPRIARTGCLYYFPMQARRLIV